MSDFFAQMPGIKDPQSKDLILFLDELDRLLRLLVESEDFLDSLWKGDEWLRGLASETLHYDILSASKELKRTIQDNRIKDEELNRHGLVGSAVRFKYAVLGKVSYSWRRWRGKLTVSSGFRSVLEAVDAILDSLISAAGGTGGAIKEFKDAIMALAPKR
jgi:hypothetical protein